MDNHNGTPYGKVIDIIETYHHDKRKLIPILQAVQEEYRYLPNAALQIVASKLDLSPARVYGVATFYAHFALKPKGKYIIRVCDGTACHVKKSTALLDALQKKFNISGQQTTTPDKLFTLETVSCLGACGLAPAVVVNEDVHGQMTPDKALRIIDDIMKKEKSHAN